LTSPKSSKPLGAACPPAPPLGSMGAPPPSAVRGNKFLPLSPAEQASAAEARTDPAIARVRGPDRRIPVASMLILGSVQGWTELYARRARNHHGRRQECADFPCRPCYQPRP